MIIFSARFSSNCVLKLIKNRSPAFGTVILILHPFTQTIDVKNMPARTFKCFRDYFEVFFAN